MTIQKGQLIVYQDLINYTLNHIKSKCSNIDAFASNVPSSLKNGSSYTISSRSIAAQANSPAHTVSAKGQVSDSQMAVVSSTTVTNEINSFLSSRGINMNPNDIVNFKDIMNFYNNIASFLSAKLMLVSNSFNSGVFIFYNNAAVTYPSVSLNHTYGQLTNAEIKSSVQDYLNAINNITNVHYANTIISYTCSSSSSSSCSSSSSSSSCSSSSSMFIAYMDI